ncbi:MAG TPA: RDD family protein [Thermoanaerobaculia bacterium]|nr:RDD family protein [Thermoanaerobaculia bacterium]
MQGWQVFFEIPGKPPVELREGESIIGRSRSSTVHIPETTVSRAHARVVVEAEGRVAVSDLGSSNGTFVNGEKVEAEHVLKDGDRLMVGDAELVLRVLPPVEPSDATVRVAIPPVGQAPAATVRQVLPPPAPVDLPLDAASRAPQTEMPTPTPAPAARIAAPPPPSTPPPPPAPRPAAPPPVPVAAAEPAPKPPGGEVLSSIEDLDRIAPPIPPPAQRSEAAPSAAAPAAAGAVGPAGFWIRCAAYLIDLVPVFVLSLIGAILPFVSQKLAFLSLVTMLLNLAWVFLIVLWMPATKGTTFGKRRLGLAIVTDTTRPGQGLGWGKAFVRLLGYMVNSLTGGIGYLLIAFTSKKQGLHDMIAGTYVVRTR